MYTHVCRKYLVSLRDADTTHTLSLGVEREMEE